MRCSLVDAHILQFNYNLIKGRTAIQLPYEYVLAKSKMITPRKYYALLFIRYKGSKYRNQIVSDGSSNYKNEN